MPALWERREIEQRKIDVLMTRFMADKGREQVLDVAMGAVRRLGQELTIKELILWREKLETAVVTASETQPANEKTDAEVKRLRESLTWIEETILQLPSGIQEDAELNQTDTIEDMSAYVGGLVWRECRKALGEE